MIRPLPFLVLLAAGWSLGASPPQTTGGAPVITVGGRSFATWQQYVQSAEFQAHGLRCGAPALDETRIESGLLPPSDCAYGSTTTSSQYDPVTCYKIPVVVHVIQSTSGQGFISQSMVQSQIDVLNEDFRAMAGTNGAQGNDALIQFELASTDPGGQPTNGITYSTNNSWFNDSGSYWNSLAWDTDRYLNIYTNQAGGSLGYVPDLPQGGIVGSNSDRVVVLWSAFGRNAPIGAPFNQGRTATHEVGHYLGLWHTFSGGCSGGSCSTSGDRICDTNPQSSPTSGCPGGTSSCGSSDPVRNYMDYTNDVCMWEFTPDQINRMRCTLEHWRPSLYSLCDDDPPPPGDDDVVSLNIDVGANSTFPVPSASFGGAAGQPGTWNAVSSGGGSTPLVALDASTSTASINVSGGNGDFSADNAGTSGDVERLLDDLQDAGSSTWTITGLGAGTYDVYVYSWAPDDRTGFTSNITISGGSNGTQVCGGQAYSGSFVQGAHYVTDTVTLSGGDIVIQVAQIGGNPSSLNGIQIVAQGGPVGTPGCFGFPCPCGNDDFAAGCANSTGQGSLLGGSGTASVTADDLVLETSQLPPNNNGLYYMGSQLVNNTFFDGRQCALGTTFRFLGSIQSSGPGGTMSFSGVAAASGGLVTAGSTWHFQCWHRDVPGTPCGTGANLSNSLSVTFTP